MEDSPEQLLVILSGLAETTAVQTSVDRCTMAVIYLNLDTYRE